MERLKQMMENNTILNAFWAEAKEKKHKATTPVSGTSKV